MDMNRLIRTTCLLAITCLLPVACTSIPVQLDGEYSALTPENATEDDVKTPVR